MSTMKLTVRHKQGNHCFHKIAKFRRLGSYTIRKRYVVQCQDCKAWVNKETAYLYDDRHICRACVNENYHKCEDCGKIIRKDEIGWVNRGEHGVCELCIDNYTQCHRCDTYLPQEGIWATDDDISICHDCSERYRVCESCYMIIHINNSFEGDCGCFFCQSCYEDPTDDIYDYSYKPMPRFLGNGAMYMGIELEIDNGKVLRDCARALREMTDDIYLKRDGSLSCGLEIVSYPATYEYHLQQLPWESMMQACQTNGFQSHDASTCGLHIHVNRSFFGDYENEQDLNIAKLILLINRFWESHIISFSRRSSASLEQWASKNQLDTKPEETEEQIIDKYKQSVCHGRYQAINLMNSNTIEFRFFRGTLKYSTFVAALQFVELFCEYAKSIKLKDVYLCSWDQLILGSGYDELKAYCKERTNTYEVEEQQECA